MLEMIKGELEKFTDKIFNKSFIENNILNNDLSLKQKVYRALTKYKFLSKKDIDEIYMDFIKRYKHKLRLLEIEYNNLKKINSENINKQNHKKYLKTFLMLGGALLLTQRESLHDKFKNDADKIEKNNDGSMKIMSVNQFVYKWKETLLSLKDKQKTEFISELQDGRLLKNRLENLVKYEKIQDIKKQFNKEKNKKYKWIRTTAKNPDPEHLKLVGKIFEIGKGDKMGNMPGERYGCKCDLLFI